MGRKARTCVLFMFPRRREDTYGVTGTRGTRSSNTGARGTRGQTLSDPTLMWRGVYTPSTFFINTSPTANPAFYRPLTGCLQGGREKENMRVVWVDTTGSSPHQVKDHKAGGPPSRAEADYSGRGP